MKLATLLTVFGLALSASSAFARGYPEKISFAKDLPVDGRKVELTLTRLPDAAIPNAYHLTVYFGAMRGAPAITREDAGVYACKFNLDAADVFTGVDCVTDGWYSDPEIGGATLWKSEFTVKLDRADNDYSATLKKSIVTRCPPSIERNEDFGIGFHLVDSIE